MPRINLRLQTLEARDVPSGTQLFAVAEDGGESRVFVFRPAGEREPPFPSQTGDRLATFTPFPGFSGGVRIAVGDVTGDGIDDVVCGAGAGGGPHVKIYDGSALLNGQVVLFDEFFAFDARFRGGVHVAVGQRGDAFPTQMLVVGAGEGGGPHVKVYTREFWLTNPGITGPSGLPQFRLANEFFAYDVGFRGGVRVAAADVNGDGRDDIVTGAGAGGGPHVRVFDVPVPNPLALLPYSHAVIDEFFAYDAGFRGGVYVAAGNVTGSSQFAEVVTGAGAGGSPHLKVYSREAAGKLQMIAETFVGSKALTSGLRVGMADLGNTSGVPGTRPFTIYTGSGYDPAAVWAPIVEPRLSGYKFHSNSLIGVYLDLGSGGFGGDSPLNVGV